MKNDSLAVLRELLYLYYEPPIYLPLTTSLQAMQTQTKTIYFVISTHPLIHLSIYLSFNYLLASVLKEIFHQDGLIN